MIRLRSAAEADLPAMAAVFVASWRGGYRGVVPDDVIDSLTVAQMTEDLRPGLADPDRSNVLAIDDDSGLPSDRVVGFARFGADRDAANAGGGYLASLYVDPSAGGRGVGRALLRRALESMPGVDITLWVFDGNDRAQDIYLRAGFRPDGARLTEPQWRTPQIRLRRPARNRARTLPPMPDIQLPRIIGLERMPIVRPLRAPFRTALREVRELRGQQVRLIGGDGLVGIGTTVATPQVTGDTDDAIAAAIDGGLAEALRAGSGRGGQSLAEAVSAIAAAAPPVPSAKAAVDLAVHDLAAAASGTTVAALLGNEPSAVRSDLTISVDEPLAMAERAAAAAAEGFDTVKLKLADASVDAERVRAVARRLADIRSAGGSPIRIRLDANQAWAPEHAVRLLDQIADLAIELVEQPVAAADLAGMAYVRARSRFPVLADESAFTAADVERIADAEAADLINLKLLKCGGLGPARDVVAACAEAGLGLLIGCMLEPIEGVRAAEALAAAASAGPMAHDLDAGWWISG